MRSPEPITRTKASATSETKSSVRKRRRERPKVEPRPPSISAACGSSRDAESAGVRPKSKPVATESSEREGQYARVEARLRQARDLRRGQPHQGADRPRRDQQSDERRRIPEIRRLSVTSCRTIRPRPAPERGADGQLLLASRGARQLQMRDVDAGDEEHDADGGEKRPEGGLHLVEEVSRTAARSDVVWPLLVVGVLLLQLAHDAGELGPRLGQRRPGRQPREHALARVVAAIEPRLLGAVEADRPVEVRRAGGRSRSLAAARRRPCAETASRRMTLPMTPRSAPKRVRQSSSLRTTAGATPGRSSASRKTPAELGARAEEREESGGHFADPEQLGLLRSARPSSAFVRYAANEESVRLRSFQSRKLGHDTLMSPMTDVVLDDDDQPFGLGIGKAPQQYRVHDAEDRGVRTDAQRERRDAIAVNPGDLAKVRSP